ncbi:MAG TPA: hypothetical protein VFO16_20750 [Pseudonocardiaceae bacterium]|nr:hypothetical protein [Pseudonocardiaceae bacterium]
MAVMSYKTEDGLADYGFSIEFKFDTGWRVYIIFQPFHQNNDGNVKSPYQAVDRHGYPYVNWPLKITSLGDARTVAALWAELDQRFHTQERRKTPQQPRVLAS